MKYTNNLIDFLNNFVNEFGVILGAILQFIVLSPNKKKKVRLAIFISIASIFTALFIVQPIIEYYKIENQKYIQSLFALSGLISMELISLLTIILPKATKYKILKILGISNEDIS